MFSQRYSAFSPKDNYSNLLGALVGGEALRSSKPFEAAMVDETATRLNALKACPKSDTEAAMVAVKNKWWKESAGITDADAILRRHFDALGTVTP